MTWLLTIVACVGAACMPLLPIEAGYSREDCHSAAARQIVFWARHEVVVRDFYCRPRGKHDRPASSGNREGGQ